MSERETILIKENERHERAIRKEMQRHAQAIRALINPDNRTAPKPKPLTEDQQKVRAKAENVRAFYASAAIAGRGHDHISNDISDAWGIKEDQIQNYLSAKGSKCLVGLKPMPRASMIYKMAKNGVLPDWIRDLGSK